LKQHKTWFDEKRSKLLDQREKPKLQCSRIQDKQEKIIRTLRDVKTVEVLGTREGKEVKYER